MHDPGGVEGQDKFALKNELFHSLQIFLLEYLAIDQNPSIVGGVKKLIIIVFVVFPTDEVVFSL